jgi:hypothetical protein
MTHAPIGVARRPALLGVERQGIGVHRESEERGEEGHPGLPGRGVAEPRGEERRGRMASRMVSMGSPAEATDPSEYRGVDSA